MYSFLRNRRRRRRLQPRIMCEPPASLPTENGVFKWTVCRPAGARLDISVLTMGELAVAEPVLVRIHSACITGDVFHSMRCDCEAQKDLALQRIADEGRGAFLYIPEHEGRGIGTRAKMRAYRIQDIEHVDTFEANRRLGFRDDIRDYRPSGRVLRALGIRRVRLLTNNPDKIDALTDLGFEVIREPIEVAATVFTAAYLATKRDNGHLLHVEVQS
jgi:3,4-dihydroxy 2-butanone 4-phosphate synthase/GTP cyclohydrolase II